MRKLFNVVAVCFLLAVCSAFGEQKAATLVSASGTVEYTSSHKEEWKPAAPNQQFRAGERIRTGKNSRAAIRLPNNNILKISPETTWSIPAAANAAGVSKPQ